MTDSPSARESGYWPRVLAQAIRIRVREIATPSLILCERAIGAERAPAFMIHIS